MNHHPSPPTHEYAAPFVRTRNVFAQFSKAQFERHALETLCAKPYYERYIGLYWLCLFLALSAQGFSMVSEFSFFQSVVAVKIYHEHLALLLTAFLVVLLEVAKYGVVHRFLAALFSLSGVQFPVAIAVVSLLLSLVSVYGSVQGGAQLAENPAKLAEALAYRADEVQLLRQEIADIKARNTWKGNTWLPKDEKALLHTKETYLHTLLDAQTETVGRAHAEVEASKQTYRYGFAGFEGLFLLSSVFLWYFRKRVAVEAQAARIPSAAEARLERNAMRSDAMRLAASAPPIASKSSKAMRPKQAPAPSVGFQYTLPFTGQATFRQAHCKTCGTAFYKQTTWQKYCSTACRKAAWNAQKEPPA